MNLTSMRVEFALIPVSSIILFIMVAIGLWIGLRSQSLTGIQAGDQISFHASPFLQVFLASVIGVLAFGFIHLSLKGARDGAEVFWLGMVGLALASLLPLGLMVMGLFAIRRSYVIITKDNVKYFDGWKTRREVARDSIISVQILPLPMAVRVKCAGEKKDLMLPMIYSKTSLMIALLRQSATPVGT